MIKNPSKYQIDIFNFIKSGSGNAIVKACAGSGKTSTAVAALQYISPNDSVLFLAFNKAIAKEIESRAPEFVDCRTTHSLGWSAIRATNRKAEMKQDKNTEILKFFAEKEIISDDEYFELGYCVKRLVGFCKSEGLVPDGVTDAKSLIPDTEETWDRMISHYDVELPDADLLRPEDQLILKRRVIEIARLVLAKGLQAKWAFDFDDMVYVPTVKSMKFEKYDWVFADELQDFNSMQHEMLKLVIKESSRLIGIGDSRQAIYSWRGANSESMDLFAKSFNCQEFPLSITYRCPKSVVRLAQTYVPEIEAAPSAEEGIVAEISDVKLDRFKPGDLIICRVNAPIIRLAYSLILAKKPAHVMGRNIGQGLASLIKKLRGKDLIDLEEKLDVWKEKELDKLRKKDPDGDETRILDKYECLKVFITNSPAQTIKELQLEIEEMFHETEEKDKILLSSIHRCKGLQADTVYILDFWMLKNGNPKREKKPHQVQERKNLAYVAITRSKKSLYFIDSRNIQKQNDGRNNIRRVGKFLQNSFNRIEEKYEISPDGNPFDREGEDDGDEESYV